MLKALLLGAGASRELGMPLRDEVNAEIVSWLNPTSLRKINASWKSRGYGHSDEVIEKLAQLLESSAFDYESVLGQWEAQIVAGRPSFHSLYAWLAQVVSLALFRRQVSNRQIFQDGLPYFSGIAAHFTIPICCGFTSTIVSLPCRKCPGDIVARLRGQVLTDAEQGNAALPFFPAGTNGINLLKIHGALDIFALGNSNDLIKLMPEAPTFDAIIDALQIANEGLLDAGLAPDAMSVTNQLPYIDENGTRQVLRRTLLSSAARLTDPYPQLLQRRFLEYFRTSLGQVDHLVAIGYGLADVEVNEVLQEWLGNAPHRRLEIVVPRASAIPEVLQPFSSQIVPTPSSTTTYLEKFR